MTKPTNIPLTKAEVQSGLDRVRFAEGLIRQLPEDHEGRNTWLLHYGIGSDVEAMREAWARRAEKPFEFSPLA